MPDNTQNLVDLLLQVWNSGSAEAVTRLYAENAERRDPNSSTPQRGAQEILDFVTEVRTGFPDFRLQIRQRLVEGNHIATEWTCVGTHRGVFQGIPPSGNRVEIDGMTLGRVENGKIIEEHAYFDRLSLLQQLGVAPAAAQAVSGSAS